MFDSPPEPDVSQDFRQALRLVPEPVFVVAARGADGSHGAMTATAFSSVSMDPPSILVCLNTRAALQPVLDEASYFSVNLLTISQEEMANNCAGRRPLDERIDDTDWLVAGTGVPVITDARLNLVCRRTQQIVFGTHCIFIGEVLSVRTGNAEKPALVYEDGAYTVVRQFAGAAPED